MTLYFERVAEDKFTLELISERFVQCDTFSYNIMVPISGDFFYVGHDADSFDLDQYTTIKPFDILLSTKLNPDFLFTTSNRPILLVLSISPHYFRAKVKSDHLGFHTVDDEGLRSSFHVLLAQLAKLKMNNKLEDGQRIVDKLVNVFYQTLVHEHVDHVSQPNESLIYDAYKLLEEDEALSQNLQDIFEDFEFSRSYVSNRFKQITGFNLLDYQRLKRISIAINNIEVPAAELCTEAGFRNEKMMKDALKLITKHSYKQLTHINKSTDLVDDPFESNSFQAFMRYARMFDAIKDVQGDPYVNLAENVEQRVTNYDEIKPFNPIWRKLTDFRTLRLKTSLNMMEEIKRTIGKLGYEYCRFHVFYKNDGTIYLDTGAEELTQLDFNTAVSMFNYFSEKTNICIHLDLITLNYDSIKEWNENDLDDFIRNLFNNQRLISFINLYHMETSKGVSIELSVDDLLEEVQYKKLTRKVVSYVEKFIKQVTSKILEPTTRWGLSFSRVNYFNFDRLDYVMNAFEERELQPKFISLDIDERNENVRAAEIEELFAIYEDLVERVSYKTAGFKKIWNIPIYMSNFAIYYNLDVFTDSEKNMLINTVVLEALVGSNYAFDGLTSVTFHYGDERIHDVSFFGKTGSFKTMLYHSFEMSLSMQGNIVFVDEGCMVVKHNNNYHVIVFSPTDKSYLYSHGKLKNTRAWTHTLVLPELTGTYKVTHYLLDQYHGNYHYILDDFTHDGFLTEEEWEYIDSISRPKMETYNYQAQKNVTIKTTLKPYDLHVYRLEKFY